MLSATSPTRQDVIFAVYCAEAIVLYPLLKFGFWY